MSLRLLDASLTILHLIIIIFNLFGWIPGKWRRAHLACILLTAGSWFILGIWYGMGFCPITEWQWQVKEQLGETNLPSSFIKYYADKLTSQDFDPSFINTITVASFAAAGIISLYVNFFYKRAGNTNKKAP